MNADWKFSLRLLHYGHCNSIQVIHNVVTGLRNFCNINVMRIEFS